MGLAFVFVSFFKGYVWDYDQSFKGSSLKVHRATRLVPLAAVFRDVTQRSPFECDMSEFCFSYRWEYWMEAKNTWKDGGKEQSLHVRFSLLYLKI